MWYCVVGWVVGCVVGCVIGWVVGWVVGCVVIGFAVEVVGASTIK